MKFAIIRYLKYWKFWNIFIIISSFLLFFPAYSMRSYKLRLTGIPGIPTLAVTWVRIPSPVRDWEAQEEKAEKIWVPFPHHTPPAFSHELHRFPWKIRVQPQLGFSPVSVHSWFSFQNFWIHSFFPEEPEEVLPLASWSHQAGQEGFQTPLVLYPSEILTHLCFLQSHFCHCVHVIYCHLHLDFQWV